MFESNMLENLQQMHFEDANGVYVPPSYFPANPWEPSKGFADWLNSLQSAEQ